MRGNAKLGKWYGSWGVLRTTALAALLLLGSGVRAQIDNGLPGIQPFDVGGFIMKDMLLRQTLPRVEDDPGPTVGKKADGKSPATPKAGAAKADTTYKASPEVSAKVRKQYLDWVAKQNPKGAEELKAVFEKHDPVQIWSEIVRSDGLHTGDVTDAFTAYWLLNWMVANRSDGTPDQVKAVREQVRPLLAANPTYARLTEAQRQELAEVLMLNFVVQHGAYSAAMKKNDSELLSKLGDAAVARFQNEMGIDLRQLTLTERGFAKKS